MYSLIRQFSAKNYRCLQHVNVRLDGGFHVLVGPNGGGKSTLFDAISFVSDLASKGLRGAVGERTDNFQDLVWRKPADNVNLQLGISLGLQGETGLPGLPKDEVVLQYEVTVCDDEDEGLHIGREVLVLSGGAMLAISMRRDGRRTECFLGSQRLGSVHHGGDTVFQYLPGIAGMYAPSSASKTSTWDRMEAVAEFLENQVLTIMLEARCLRKPSSSDFRSLRHMNSDGSNLPWVVQRLQRHKVNFDAWLDHLRTVIEDIEYVRVVRREEDRKAYLVVRRAGVNVRSFFVPDGILHLMALSLPAYLAEDHGQVLMIEEPENSMHPLAIEAIYESLSSVYDSHVLVATHSPLFLSCVDPEAVLCFAQNTEGATQIVRGNEHPHFKHWQSKADNDLLLARDIL